MIAFLSLFLHVLVSPLKTQARLEAETLVFRHQLNVLRRQVPSKPRLTVADRLIFVWLSPVSEDVECDHDFPTGDRQSVASDGLPTVLALEVTLSWRSAENTRGDPPPGCAAHPWRTAQAWR
jgi:hypothetical protein